VQALPAYWRTARPISWPFLTVGLASIALGIARGDFLFIGVTAGVVTVLGVLYIALAPDSIYRTRSDEELQRLEERAKRIPVLGLLTRVGSRLRDVLEPPHVRHRPRRRE
jgi:hypothetical protein